MSGSGDGFARRVLSLGSIAELVDGRLGGDPDIEVVGVAPVEEANRRQMAFLAAKRYARYVSGSEAAAFLVSAEMESALPDHAPRVVVDNGHSALRTVLLHFFPVEEEAAAIHPTAVIGRGVELGEGVDVGPYAVLEDHVRVGTGSRIGAHCVVGRGTVIGERTQLHPQVVVYHGSMIGSDVIVHAGACLGADGFGYTFVDGAHRKMPQVGRCVIEDDVEIGANTTIDRGSLGDTVVGRGVKIDNLVQIAHNVRIGALSLVAALAGFAGSTRVGKRVWMGGQAGVINQLEIGDGARIAVASVVMRDVPAGETVSGHPARPHREDLRRQAHMGRLSRLADRVARLEEETKRLAGE
jgi:UDP-3-O-[3-hydroxymyristoyl] glucosamine N-acyltransferase